MSRQFGSHDPQLHGRHTFTLRVTCPELQKQLVRRHHAWRRARDEDDASPEGSLRSVMFRLIMDACVPAISTAAFHATNARNAWEAAEAATLQLKWLSPPEVDALFVWIEPKIDQTRLGPDRPWVWDLVVRPDAPATHTQLLWDVAAYEICFEGAGFDRPGIVLLNDWIYAPNDDEAGDPPDIDVSGHDEHRARGDAAEPGPRRKTRRVGA